MNVSLRARVSAVGAALVVVALSGGVASAAPSTRATLAGSVPQWANAASFKRAADTSTPVGFRVYLGWSDENAAAALAQAVSNPRSTSYGQFLTPAQFRQRFAPSQSSVASVQNWLKTQGFTVDYTPLNNLYIAAEGTVAQAAAAFGTTFGAYTVQGMTLLAPEAPLTVPASLAGAVSSVVGLDDSAQLVHTDHIVDAPPAPAFVNAPPCSTYYGELSTASTLGADGTQVPQAYGTYQPWAPCGYTPAQVKGAYGLTGQGLTGAGQTVAIIDAYASPTILDDVNTYSSLHGVPEFGTQGAGRFSQVVAPGTYRHPEKGMAQDPQGWYGEETLDVEAVHSVAPGADVVYVGAPNNFQDLDAALNHVVDRGLASIVTNSYGWSTELLPTGYIKPYLDIQIQAAAEGIGVYFSSGDNGDETNGVQGALATPDWPASSPWVTAVGGTSLAVNQDNSYGFEVAWETTTSTLKSGAWSPAVSAAHPGTWLYGGGGGTSRLFAQPSYQAGVVPSSMATANGARSQAMRVIPDVSAFGDPQTGFLVGQTQTFPDGTTKYSEYRIGGTSLSSPMFAGIMALVQQEAGSAVGFANPALYQAGASAYHDIVPANDPVAVVRANFRNGVDATDEYSYILRTTDFQGLTIHTAAGYDDETGLGTPANGFVSSLVSVVK